MAKIMKNVLLTKDAVSTLMLVIVLSAQGASSDLTSRAATFADSSNEIELDAPVRQGMFVEVTLDGLFSSRALGFSIIVR